MTAGWLGRLVSSRYLALVLRLMVGSFFVYASMTKITYPAQFAEATANYRLVPYWLLNFGAVVLPWMEFVCGLFLFIGLFSRACAVLIGVMLVLFNIMILINMAWGVPINCGCYDTIGDPIGWKKIAENAIMLAAVVQIYFFDRFLGFHQGGLTGISGAGHDPSVVS
ncbi:MAG: DoxX family membrane protein [Deltaproteobacteria bacterium]|nr:DoxX family membrane protein [Deltaproteobacteria bacterium]